MSSYPEYMSFKELAAYCSVSIPTLKRWQKRGMPYCKVGNLVRIKRSDFDAWMLESRAKSTTRSRLKSALDEAVMEAKGK
jgi:excisionase family DNA binding protein